MIIKRIQNALDNLKFNYNKVVDEQDQTVINLQVTLNNTNTDCYIDIRYPDNHLLIRSIASTSVPVAKRKPIAEFIAWANSSTSLGCFQLNMETGMLEYQCTYLYDEYSTKTESIFTENFCWAMNVLDNFFPGVMSIIYGNKIPESEFKRITAGPDPNLN